MGRKNRETRRQNFNLETTIRDGELPSVTIDDFIKSCLSVEESPEIHRMLEDEVRKNFNDCHPTYQSSDRFQSLTRRFMTRIDGDKIHLVRHVANYSNALKQAISEKAFKVRKMDGDIDSSSPPPKKAKMSRKELSEANKEKWNTVNKFSKILSKVQKEIKELELKEIEWDDEDNEDTTYLLLCKYKAMAVKAFHKLCDYTQESKSAGSDISISFSETNFSQINKSIESFVNGSGQFPDYVDILEIVEKVNSEENLNLPHDELEKQSKDAFKMVGERMQCKRKQALKESLFALIGDAETDPAEADDGLKQALAKNEQYWQKINEVIDDFAAREEQGKESAVTAEDEIKERKNSENVDDEEDDDEEDDEEEEESFNDEDMEREFERLANLPSSDDEQEAASSNINPHTAPELDGKMAYFEDCITSSGQNCEKLVATKTDSVQDTQETKESNNTPNTLEVAGEH